MPDYGWAYVNLDVLKTIDGPSNVTGTIAIIKNSTTFSGSQRLVYATASNKVGIGLNFPTVLPAKQQHVSASFPETTAVRIVGDLQITGSALISGSIKAESLEVDTVISSSNLIVRDPVIGLGFGDAANETGSVGDRGFIFGLAGDNNQAIIWDQTSGSFVIGKVKAQGPDKAAYDIATSDLSKLRAAELTGSRGGHFGDSVGIGTTAPAEPLHIVSAGNGGIEIENTSGAPSLTFDMPNNEEARILFKEDNTTAGSIVYDSQGGSDNDLIFKGKGSNTEIMRLDSDGKVGVGTPTPAGLLHVSSSAAATKGLVISGKGNQSADLFVVQDKTGADAIKINAGGDLAMSAVSASSTVKVAGALSASDNTLFVDPTTARVGINKALPDAFLHVSSSAAATKGMIISADDNQSADLLVIQNKAGASSVKVDQDGITTLANLTSSLINLSNPATGAIAGPGSFLALNALKDVVLATPAGGGTPAGSNTQVQFNNGGSFGASADLTFASNTLTVANDVSIADKLIHTGDTDTHLKFDTDKIELIAGNETLLTLTEDTQDIVIVGDGGDVDFQVKTSGGNNTIFAQGSDGKVGIGQGAPTARLHVSQSNQTANNTSNHLLRIEDGNPTTGKPQSAPLMLITASFAGDGWSEGFVGINTASPQGALHVMSQLDGGNGKHTFIVDSDKVGIGTNGINAKLHVSGNTNDQKTVLIEAVAQQSVDVVEVKQKTGATCFKISETGTTTITDLTQTGGSINNVTIGASTAAPVTMTAGAVKYRSKANSDSPYSVVASDYIIGVNTTGGAVEIDLQAASSAGAGRMLIIKDIGGAAGTNNITIDPNGSEKIDGQSTLVIAANSGSVMLFCDGSNYFIAGTR